MAKLRVPKTKVNRLAGSTTSRSRFMLGSMGSSLATLAVGTASMVGISSALQSLGLPSIPEIVSNPLYLGAGALGLLFLLK